MRGLETTTEISRALGGVTDLDRVLELVVKRSRALIDARAAEIALLDGDEFVIAAVAGEGVEDCKGTRMPIASRSRRGAAHRAPAALRRSRATRSPRASSARVRDRDADDVPQPAGRLPGRVRPADGDRRSTRRTSGCCRRSRPAPRRRSRPRRTPARRRCGAASRPPRPSARAGRASCTTRRCSSSPGCACCSPARAAAATRSGCAARSTARSSRSRPRSATCAR